MSLRRISQFLSAALFGAAACIAQTTTTGTLTQSTDTPPVGLASSETLQINVVNTASNSPNGTAASCTGTISFLNASGAAIGSPTTFTVASGSIASVSLPFGKTGATGTRTEVRGAIARTFTPGPTVFGSAPCSLQATLETYDTSTGVTHVYLPNINVPNYVILPVGRGGDH